MSKNPMVATWTPEAKAARRLAAGPKSKSLEKLLPVQAIARCFSEITKVCAVLSEEGVSLEKLKAKLCYYTAASDAHEAHTRHETIIGTSTNHAIELLRKFEPLEQWGVIFLGIDWTLFEGDPRSFVTEEVSNSWITRFNAYPWDDAKAITRMLTQGV